MSDKAILDGKTVVPIDDLKTWATAQEIGKRRVGLDHVGTYRVSTVFLGLDHGFGGSPLWFETMVFTGSDSSDSFCDRYETYAEAEAGHIYVVEALRAGEKPEELDPYD